MLHVDFGRKTEVEVRHLMPLPLALKRLPPLAHRAFVIGIRPPENLVTWSPEAHHFVCCMVEKPEFHHMSAWIFVSASGCLWLHDVKLHHRLKSIASGIEAVGQAFAVSLIASGQAVSAPPPPFPGHSGCLSDMKMQFLIDEQWTLASRAFLPDNDIQHVYLLHFKTVAHFFVRPASFDSSLCTLEQELSFRSDPC